MPTKTPAGTIATLIDLATSVYNDRLVQYHTSHGSNGPQVMGGSGMSGTGNATAISYATTNLYTKTPKAERLEGTATTTAIAAWFESGLSWLVEQGFTAVIRFAPSTGNAANATRQMFAGFGSTTSGATDVTPSTGISDAFGVGCDAADANWQIFSTNGTGTVVKIDTGITKSAADRTEMYEVTIVVPPGGTGSTISFKRVTGAGNVGTVFTSAVTPPPSTTSLAMRVTVGAGGTSSVVGVALARITAHSAN